MSILKGIRTKYGLTLKLVLLTRLTNGVFLPVCPSIAGHLGDGGIAELNYLNQETVGNHSLFYLQTVKGTFL